VTNSEYIVCEQIIDVFAIQMSACCTPQLLLAFEEAAY
jgi:hypothetical protein